MTPTKWTSCAVEGSLPPAHRRRLRLGLPLWSGHSCPLLLTLTLPLTFEVPQSPRTEPCPDFVISICMSGRAIATLALTRTQEISQFERSHRSHSAFRNKKINHSEHFRSLLLSRALRDTEMQTDSAASLYSAILLLK
jgi:hypothetical protein